MSTPLVIKCGHLAGEMSALPSLPCPRVTPEHPARPPSLCQPGPNPALHQLPPRLQLGLPSVAPAPLPPHHA